MLYQLIYYSNASSMANEGELYTLPIEAQSKNEIKSITGLLVFVEGVHNGSVIARFMQVLEGPEDEVKTTYEKIKKDKRHQNVCILTAGSIAKRSFEGWAMKFEKVNLNAYPALFDFFTLDQHLSQGTVFSNCDAALNFLRSF